jgi:predicted transglutaminase-like cysteine proteinase
MSAKARARYAAQWLPVVLFLGFVAVAAIDTNATAASKVPVIESVAAGNTQGAQPERPPQPIVIAALVEQTPAAAAPVAAPITTPDLRPSIAPLISSTTGPAPARFFTINEVMAKHVGRAPQGNIQLASVDPTATPDRETAKGAEPFGLFTFVAPDSIVWFKWRKVADDIRAQEPALLRCMADTTTCSPAATRFVAIVKEARGHKGRVRLNFVNQRVNNAIRYTSDMTQWGTPDEWSAPFAGGKGSFETGLGDCEDYAIAKYVALRAAGVSANQLRVLLVRDNIARLDHAVLAANEDGHWFILDNRWTAAVEDNDVRRFTPLFALDDQGVKLLLVPYASRVDPKIEPMSEVLKDSKQKRTQGEEMTDSAPSIDMLRLRPSVL